MCLRNHKTGEVPRVDCLTRIMLCDAGGYGLALSFVLAFHWLGFFDVDVPSTALAVALISLAATVVESLPINMRVDDNLSVPGVAALLSFFMLRAATVLSV